MVREKTHPPRNQAKSQAQIDTAREKEINRANAYARQLMIEAESEAKANAALLEAQALDIRAVSSAYYPEILAYRYRQDILNRMAGIAHKLPKIINIGNDAQSNLNYMRVAQQMLGLTDQTLFTQEEMSQLRERGGDIMARIKERSGRIENL